MLMTFAFFVAHPSTTGASRLGYLALARSSSEAVQGGWMSVDACLSKYREACHMCRHTILEIRKGSLGGRLERA